MSDNTQNKDKTTGAANSRKGFWERLSDSVTGIYDYAVSGVWSETRRSWRVNVVKTISLSLKSFLNSDLQMRASALTYQTVLAIVPALALLFAIGRGFGFQNILQSQLFSYFPSQREALETAFTFVDSYLKHSSEGIFVGIGIVFLLWTLISLISSVEDSFNKIWGIAHGRTIWRQITDYTAIFLILPVIMICASGINVFVSSELQHYITIKFLSDGLSWLLDLASLALTWVFFAGTYMLIPNTKVKFTNAMIAGILSGTAFLILQWLFLSGQLYVTKYNAIYGSFSLLPLLLIWLQLVWVITLSGAVLCYSSQNIFEFSFANQIEKISVTYRWRITLAVLAVITQRFIKGEKPLTDHAIAQQYGLPISLVTSGINQLIKCNLLQRVIINETDDTLAVAPAVDPATLTLGDVLRRVGETGSKDFIPNFDTHFATVNNIEIQLEADNYSMADKIPLSSLTIDSMNLKK